jgi:hypothetical protein
MSARAVKVDEEHRRILGILEAQLADMDASDALDEELEERCFDELAELEERAEVEALFREAGEGATPADADAFLARLPE